MLALMVRCIILIGALQVGGLNAGCQWKGVGSTQRPRPSGQRTWQLGPASMRMYPAPRLHAPDGQWLLEAGVELLDPMNDSTKGVGTIRFELYAGGRGPGHAVGKRLYVWNVCLLTHDDQQVAYDSVMRAYRFTLMCELLPEDVQLAVLQATFAGRNGLRLSAQMPVAVPPQSPRSANP